MLDVLAPRRGKSIHHSTHEHCLALFTFTSPDLRQSAGNFCNDNLIGDLVPPSVQSTAQLVDKADSFPVVLGSEQY